MFRQIGRISTEQLTFFALHKTFAAKGHDGNVPPSWKGKRNSHPDDAWLGQVGHEDPLLLLAAHPVGRRRRRLQEGEPVGDPGGRPGHEPLQVAELPHGGGRRHLGRRVLQLVDDLCSNDSSGSEAGKLQRFPGFCARCAIFNDNISCRCSIKYLKSFALWQCNL